MFFFTLDKFNASKCESPPSYMIDVLIISSGKSCHDNPKDRSFSSEDKQDRRLHNIYLAVQNKAKSSRY